MSGWVVQLAHPIAIGRNDLTIGRSQDRAHGRLPTRRSAMCLIQRFIHPGFEHEPVRIRIPGRAKLLWQSPAPD